MESDHYDFAQALGKTYSVVALSDADVEAETEVDKSAARASKLYTATEDIPPQNSAEYPVPVHGKLQDPTGARAAPSAT